MAMTLQEIYTKARDRMLAQGVRSLTLDGLCAYRGEDGRVCAVGALITDEALAEAPCPVEGMGPSMLVAFKLGVGPVVRSPVSVLIAYPNEAEPVEAFRGVLVRSGVLAEPDDGLNAARLQLMAALQTIHDGDSPLSWRKLLACMARDRGFAD